MLRNGNQGTFRKKMADVGPRTRVDLKGGCTVFCDPEH